MTQVYPSRVVLCPPADRGRLDAANVLACTPFTPTVEHSLSTCDSCGGKIWIAQQQLDLVNSPLIKTCKLCMFCLSEVNKVLSSLRVEAIDVNPDIAFAHKRIA